MNEKFFTLPLDKQERIINAGLNCFAKSGYRHTVTDDIAAQAGISKGLLFHYFENKKGLYEYLFGYSMRFIAEKLKSQSVLEGDDFFAIIAKSTRAKTEMMKQHPALFNFTISAYYDESAPAMDYIQTVYQEALKNSNALMMQQVDRTKFREGMDVETLLNMVFWMADGFMLRQQRAGNLHDMDAISKQFADAIQVLKRAFYKPEFL